MRSTTLTKRIFRSGRWVRSRSTAASASRVGTSPAQAITTSGSPPSSLLAHFQMPIPAVQCLIAASMSSHWGSGCFLARTGRIGDRKQGVGIGWKIYPNDVRLLVDHDVQEARVLMAVAVVVLPPYVRGEQIVERSDGLAPGNLVGGFEPFGELIEHGIDDVDEGFVAGEDAVTAGA